jgi:hypothetical protein
MPGKESICTLLINSKLEGTHNPNSSQAPKGPHVAAFVAGPSLYLLGQGPLEKLREKRRHGEGKGKGLTKLVGVGKGRRVLSVSQQNQSNFARSPFPFPLLWVEKCTLYLVRLFVTNCRQGKCPFLFQGILTRETQGWPADNTSYRRSPRLGRAEALLGLGLYNTPHVGTLMR